MTFRAACLLLLASSTAWAAPAGSAFGVFSAVQAQPWGARAKVIEIRGDRGEPSPVQWTAVLTDPTARGGIREITVAAGRITSERTPLRGMAAYSESIPLDRAALTLDSPAAFAAANREAVRNEVGFHWIDYRLAVDPRNRAPVWDLRLYDNMGAPVGSLRISAAGGTIVEPFTPDPAFRAAQETTESPSGVREAVGNAVEATGEAVQRTRESVGGFFRSVKRGVFGGEEE